MKPVFSAKDQKPTVSLSVRELCSFVLRRGDVKSSTGFSEMINGSAIHRMLQEQAKQQDELYRSEVSLKSKLDFSNYILEVSGRADGVSFDGNEYTVDEIKSVIYPLSLIDEHFSRLHLAQAKCYAYMLAKAKNLDIINVKLIYYHVEYNTTRTFSYSFTASQVTEFFYSLVRAYCKWAELSLQHYRQRTDGAKNLRFPFGKARAGQSGLMKECFNALTKNYCLYVNAPTGIGKTISTLYPAVLSFTKSTDKIFYLTAKTSTQSAAEDTVRLICTQNNFLKSITISAKKKMCISPGQGEHDYPCETCERGIGYYDRVNDAIFDVITNQGVITSEIVKTYAQKYELCPFEFSLDLAEWCDVIIGDYNYVFDPNASIVRFDETGEKYALLVDEAHNLADRAREMFSAELKLESFKAFDGVFKDDFVQLDETIKKVMGLIKSVVSDAEEYSEYVSFDLPEALYLCVNRLEIMISEALKNDRDVFNRLEKEQFNALISLMLDCRHFAETACGFDKDYVRYVDQDYTVRLYCVQPGRRIKRVVKTYGSAIFFSATLMPWDYYLNMLGFEDSDLRCDVPSPFVRDNFLILAYGLSTKYNDRDANLEQLARAIKAAVSAKTGNYLVFFPSFSYMEKLSSLYRSLYPDQHPIMQKRKMSSEERDSFIAAFKNSPDQTLVGFAVMGGIFSEGIDLRGDRLSGVVIVGTGLPSPCVERSAVAAYFDENDENGFDYSMFFPGMNRVFQAMGRVIRTENDRGFALLIDERFLHEQTREIFPPFWQDIKKVSEPKNIYKIIRSFL